MLITNPAFGIWDWDSIGLENPDYDYGEPALDDGPDHTGCWCPCCKEKGFYNWRSSSTHKCDVCGTVPEEYVKGSVKGYKPKKLKVTVTRY